MEALDRIKANSIPVKTTEIGLSWFGLVYNDHSYARARGLSHTIDVFVRYSAYFVFHLFLSTPTSLRASLPPAPNSQGYSHSSSSSWSLSKEVSHLSLLPRLSLTLLLKLYPQTSAKFVLSENYFMGFISFRWFTSLQFWVSLSSRFELCRRVKTSTFLIFSFS